MYYATCVVLQEIMDNGADYTKHGDANSAYNLMTSFEFILTLHLIKEIMGTTDCLCQALQQKSQDILNAIHLVRTTKVLIQKLRDDGWQDLLKTVTSFCEEHDIHLPNFDSTYIARQGRARHQKDHMTMEDHFRVNVF